MVNMSTKDDYKDHKLRWDLLPIGDIEDIVKLYTAGAVKYGDNSWQELPDGYNRYKAAMFRHLVEYEKGNEFDNETGGRHLAAVAWNAIAMLHLSKQLPNITAATDKINQKISILDDMILKKIDTCNSILNEIK